MCVMVPLMHGLPIRVARCVKLLMPVRHIGDCLPCLRPRRRDVQQVTSCTALGTQTRLTRCCAHLSASFNCMVWSSTFSLPRINGWGLELKIKSPDHSDKRKTNYCTVFLSKAQTRLFTAGWFKLQLCESRWRLPLISMFSASVTVDECEWKSWVTELERDLLWMAMLWYGQPRQCNTKHTAM